MGRTYVIGMFVLACLAGCAGNIRGPEAFRVYDNMDATQRVDVMPDGHGSAVVLTQDGYLLTCFHVSGKGDHVLLVNVADGDKPAVAYPARVVATDEKHDLAVLKVDRAFEKTAVLADIAEVHATDAIYDVGYPYDLGRMSGVGNVKAVGWNYEDENKPDLKVENGLALDVPNGPGTSGSGIYLARNGKLVGLMQMVLGVGPDDGRRVIVHVAIPVDTIRAFLDRAHIPYRTVEPTWSDNPPP